MKEMQFVIVGARHLAMQGWADPGSMSGRALLVTGSNMFSMPHNHGKATAISKISTLYPLYNTQHPEAIGVSATDK